jgi:transcriptional regulator with XRE-family HTH domain
MTEEGAALAIDVHIGALVRGHRRASGMSQDELAQRLGVSFQQIQKYESGENRISTTKLVQVARALSIPIAALFEGLDGDDLTADPLALFCKLDGAADFMRGALVMPPAVRSEIFRLGKAWTESED